MTSPRRYMGRKYERVKLQVTDGICQAKAIFSIATEIVLRILFHFLSSVGWSFTVPDEIHITQLGEACESY